MNIIAMTETKGKSLLSRLKPKKMNWLNFSLVIFIIVKFVWLVVPISMAVLWSLVDPSHPWSYPDVFPKALSFARWGQMWETTSLPMAIKNSYMIAFAVSILTVVLAMPTAYAFGRMEFRGKKILELASLLPMVMPSMIIAVFLSSVLYDMEMYDPYTNIVIAHTVLSLPYALRILAAGFKGVPHDVIDACRDMGAGKVRTFQHAFLPMLKPAIMASLIFCLVRSIEEFSMSYVLGAPDFITIPTILYSFLGYSFIRPDAAVVSMILVIPNVCLMLLIENFLKGNYLSHSTGKG